jgi:uncharacterized protein
MTAPAAQTRSEEPPAARSRSPRFEVLDAMRGFALCGILLINLPHMGWLVDTSTPVPGTLPGSASGALWWVQMLLVEGTMRGLFSLLFGASMILFLAKVERGAATAAQALRLMCRRLLWLFLFGVINASLLLWPGDILNIYAMAGLLVLPFWRAKPRTLAAAAAAVILGLSIWAASNQLPKRAWLAEGRAIEAEQAAGIALRGERQHQLTRWREWQANRLTPAADVANERSARLGGYGDNLRFLSRVSWEWFWDLRATLRWVLDAAALMLAGMLLFRLGILQGEASRRTCWRLVLIGYGVGIPLKAIEALADWRLYIALAEPEFWHFFLPALAAQPARLLVTLGHVGLFLLVWKAAPSMRPLQALGRMAFTGYLLQSVLAALIFSGFGLALWGRLDLVQLWLVAAAIWMLQIVGATLWLKRFAMGPLEWVWRALTYGPRWTRSRAAATDQAIG